MNVDAPTVQDTVQILQRLKERYEQHHQVTIQDEALAATAALATRYMQGRQLPDGAIDLLDEACATARGKTKTVNIDALHTVIARATGIPVSRLSLSQRQRLGKLADRLSDRVIGQVEVHVTSAVSASD